MVRQLGYLGIGVRDVARWEGFATTILGMEAAERLPDGTLYLRMDEYHHRLLLHPTGREDLEYAGWMVPGPSDLEALERRLQGAGVRVERGSPQERGVRRVVEFIRFTDPLGVPVEAFYGLQVLSERPFHPGRPLTGFRTGDLGMGHLVLAVGDEREREEALRFYRDLLGLRLTDLITFQRAGMEVRATFLHCNPRHHSLALIQVPSPPRRMLHFMVEVNSLDDVGTAYDLCLDRGVPIAATLGRHSNDHMLSFYLVSPSGFEIEYGYGGRTVDDRTWVVQHHRVTKIWGHRREARPF